MSVGRGRRDTGKCGEAGEGGRECVVMAVEGATGRLLPC